MKKIISFILFIFCLSFSFSGSVFDANGQSSATLFLSPGSGTYTIGQSFNVVVMVNSGGGVGINAAEGVIKFDPSFLSVSSVSDSGSIFKLWTVDPNFSNSAGTISFGGGAPGAYKGTAGNIFTVKFSTKKAGDTNVSFTSGVILAADGKGTNVFGGFGNAKYTIKEKEVKEVVEPVKKTETTETKEKGILPPFPDIESETHPEQEVWYSDNNPKFTWKLLPDLIGVSYLMTDDPEKKPGNVSDGVVELVDLEDVSDGINYFSVKFQNKFGWGQVTQRKVLIDATSPKPFVAIFDNEGDSTNPIPKLRFSTTDETSGLDHYMIYVNGMKNQVSLQEVANGYYRFSPLLPEEFDVQVIALDKAGNKASSSLKFIIDPLKAPRITNIPKVINKRDQLIIQGTSFYPDASVVIYLKRQGKDAEEKIVITDNEGNWSYFHEGFLEKGNYEVWAKLIDKRKAQSLDSAKHIVIVESPSIVDQFGLWIILTLILIIILLVLFIIYQQKKFTEEKMRIKRETEELKMKLTKIFAALREEVDELVELADKKAGFSESERRVKEKLQESLDISEEFIGKEVEDVEKEIKIPQKKRGK